MNIEPKMRLNIGVAVSTVDVGWERTLIVEAPDGRRLELKRGTDEDLEDGLDDFSDDWFDENGVVQVLPDGAIVKIDGTNMTFEAAWDDGGQLGQLSGVVPSYTDAHQLARLVGQFAGCDPQMFERS